MTHTNATRSERARSLIAISWPQFRPWRFFQTIRRIVGGLTPEAIASLLSVDTQIRFGKQALEAKASPFDIITPALLAINDGHNLRDGGTGCLEDLRRLK